MQKTVAFYTLGCKLNFSETSSIGRQLTEAGMQKVPFEAGADVYVVNTCSVTDNADKKCKKIVKEALRHNPNAFVAIVGCYAQLKPKEIAEIPGVDLVLGASEKFNLVPHLANLTKGDATKICSCDIDTVTDFKSSYSVNDRTRTFLKVQDGCDYSCTFCTIPMARGKSRSDRIENVVADAQSLASKGVKEIVLTGINLGDFGKSEEGGKKHTENFFDLLKALEQETNMPRYRISSIEPNLLTNEIIEFVAKSKRIMPHFHIPLQSGSDAVLKLMQRRYTRDLYQERVDLIKKIMPHACIGVDVIVGSPGETEAYFKESLEFIHTLDIAYLHVFTYSERAATKALTIKPIVPMQERHERNKILRNLSYQKLQYFTESQRGATRKVLFESPKVNKENEGMIMLEGFTDNYIKVETPHRAEWSNEIIDWTLV